MAKNDTLSERTPGLQFVWWETKKGEEAQVWWGQLAGSTHRLHIIVDQLETLPSKRNINSALTELAYHLENDFVRIYELQERALGFLNAIIHDNSKIKSLKKKKERQQAFTALQEQVPTPADPLAALLNLLDEEIKMRHTHTHEQFLNLVLDTGYDIHDPQDALLDLHNNEYVRKKLERFLRKEMRRLAHVYGDKVTAIYETAWSYLKAADDCIRRTT